MKIYISGKIGEETISEATADSEDAGERRLSGFQPDKR